MNPSRKLKKTFSTVLLFTSVLCTLGFTSRKPLDLEILSNPGVVEISDTKVFSAIFAVSDVHGMSSEIQKALSAAKVVDNTGHWTAGNSLLVVVGDSIDKGPDTVGVIDYWRSLASQAQAAGGMLVHLLGNHEAELLANPLKPTAVLAQELQSKNMSVNDLVDPGTPRGLFLHQEPLAGRIGNWLFSHAGLYPSMSWPDFRSKASDTITAGAYGDPFILGATSILEAKGWWKNQADRDAQMARLNQIGFTGLVQGHQPAGYNIDNRIGAIQGGHFVKIDCGASPPSGSNPIQVLKFPHPEQLMGSQLPDMLVISDDGSSAPIQVTELVGDVKPHVSN